MVFDPFEEAVVLEWLHLHHHQLGYSSVRKLSTAITDQNSALDLNKVVQAINKKPVSADLRAAIVTEGLELIARNAKPMIEAVTDRHPRSLSFLQAILARFNGVADDAIGPEASAAQKASGAGRSALPAAISDNWATANLAEPPAFWSGAYQMVRLYKPLTVGDEDRLTPKQQARRDQQQAVICEIVYVDAKARESILITAEGNEYRGAIFTNHEHIIATVYQRIVAPGKINQRYVATKAVDFHLPFYSGLCVKIGDSSRRPLASDALFIPIPEAGNEALYTELWTMMARPWSNTQRRFLPTDSNVSDYLSDNPPRGAYDPDAVSWKRVRLLKDSPELGILAAKNSAGAAYFREPIRTIASDDLVVLGDREPPPLFRQSAVRRARAQPASDTKTSD